MFNNHALSLMFHPNNSWEGGRIKTPETWKFETASKVQNMLALKKKKSFYKFKGI